MNPGDPLHEVPVAVKDQLNTAGIRTTSGTPIFNDFVPDEDATVVAKLKSAGAILLGKQKRRPGLQPVDPLRTCGERNRRVEQQVVRKITPRVSDGDGGESNSA